MADIVPRQHKISSKDHVMARNRTDSRFLNLYKPLVLSLPSNEDLMSLLTSLSTRLTNRYLVRRVLQYSKGRHSSTMAYLYDIAMPFVWYQRSAGSASDEWLRDESQLRAWTEGDQSDEG